MTTPAHQQVEFRLLQLFLSATGGDRVTLGLIHWDGATLRHAFSSRVAKACEPSLHDTVVNAVKSIERDVINTALPTEPISLGELFPVRAGLGAALCWTDVSKTRTRNAELHFAELSEELRLLPSDKKREKSPLKALESSLVKLGTELEQLAPERVKTKYEISRRLSYKSPLSWQNGRWHHTIVVAFDTEENVIRAIGQIDACIPQTDVAVVIVVPGDLTENPNATDALKETRGGQLLEVLDEKDSSLTALERRIRADLKSVH